MSFLLIFLKRRKDMAEENTTQEIQQEENEALEANISQIVDSINNNNFSFYFYAPPLSSPSGGMSVLFKQARILKDEGYDVKIIYEPRVDERASYQASMQAQKRVHVFEKLNPSWLEFDISDLEFIPQIGSDERGNQPETIKYSDGEEENLQNLQLRPQDFVIIPEGTSHVMQNLAQSPSKKIILAQSWIYILNSIQPGYSWQSYGINDCISISDAVTEYINTVFPGTNIKQCKQSINRDLFYPPQNLSDKAPVIAFSSKRGPENRMKTYNVIRNFQQWYPQYKWFRFVELNDLSKEEYAERLRTSALVLYTDEIAGFGTMPLEAMACGTHVVGWTPFGGKEYISDRNGFWANNGDVFQLSELLGIAIDKWLNGELDSPAIQEEYEKILSNYTQEEEKNSVIKTYKEYVNERINEIKQLGKEQ